jgi:tryptophan halogenase
LDSQSIKEVTIVGGGTAGWLTAANLNAQLNAGLETPAVRVVLIESPNVPIIGVGEGTVPSLVARLKSIGVDEAAFFRETNGSFKQGVRFEGWNLDENGKPCGSMSLNFAND